MSIILIKRKKIFIIAIKMEFPFVIKTENLYVEYVRIAFIPNTHLEPPTPSVLIQLESSTQENKFTK